MIEKEKLILGFEKRLTVEEIAKELNTTPRKVYYYINYHNLILPKSSYKKRTAWNKGLTKDDERIERSTRLAREKKKLNGNPVWNKGLKTGCLSEEHKRKIGNALQKDIPIKTEILQELINQNLSSEEMGKKLNVSGSTIRKWLRKLNIRTNVWDRGHKSLLSEENRIKSIKASKDRIKADNIKKYNKEKYCEYKVCLECQQEFAVNKSYDLKVKKFCSKSCHYKANRKIRGKDHFNYKGNMRRGEQTTRHWADYVQFKKEVHIRDENKCCLCLSKGKLDVHHIDGWMNNKEKRFDVDNGISFCKKCHKNVHKRCGQKNYTLQAFNENYTIIDGICFENII